MAAFTIYSGADDALSFNVTDADDATILQAALDAYTFTLNVTHVGSSIIVLTATGTATADSTVVVSLTDTQTATLTPGEYAYQLTSELGTDFDVIDDGTITVKEIAAAGTAPEFTLIVGTNSYITTADADTYFLLRYDSDAWFELTALERAKALVTATRRIDTQRFAGQRVTATQALEFPRTIDGTDQTAIPPRVSAATCEEAIGLATNDSRSALMEQGVKSIWIGSVREEYYRSGATTVLTSEAKRMLRPYISTAVPVV